MNRVLDIVRRWSDMPIAIQLGHAGRKASTEVPWQGGAQISPSQANGWQTVAPSALSYGANDCVPLALDRDGLARVQNAFAQAARRAARLNLDAVQLHGAHGYLLHQFLSPLSNRRDDEYGGSLENRMRFPLEVFEAVRAAFPASRPVTIAGLRHGLGRGRLDHRADRRLCAGARNARMRCHSRLERRPDPPSKDSGRAGIPGSARSCGQIRNTNASHRRWADHRIRAGGNHSEGWRRRLCRARPRHLVRSALAMARGRAFRRAGQGAQPVSSLATVAIPESFRPPPRG